jgi:hypothetical protein
VVRLVHVHLGVEQLGHPLGRGDGPLGHGHDPAQHPHGPHQQSDVGVEGDQLADGQPVVDHEVPAVAQHQHQPDGRQQLERRPEPGPHRGPGHRGLVDVVGLGPGPPLLHALGAEALDHPHAGDGLLDHLGQLGRLLLDRHLGREQLGAHPPGEHDEERQGAQGQQRQQRVDQHEDHGRGQDRHDVGDRQRDDREEVLELLEVGVGPAHQLAGGGAVVERERQPHQVGEHPVPQVGLRPAGLAEGHVAAQPGEGRRGQRDQADHHRPADDGVLVALLHALVDRPLHQRRDADPADRPEQADRHPGEDPHPLRPHLGEEQLPPLGSPAFTHDH